LIKKLSDGHYIIGSTTEAALLSLNPADRDEHPLPIYPGYRQTGKWAKWFPYGFYREVDHEPEVLLNLVRNNNLQVPLLNTNVDFVIGNGVGMFRKVITADNKITVQPYVLPEVEAWLNDNGANSILTNLATDFYYTGNYFLEGVLTGEKKVSTVKHHHPTNARAGLLDATTGAIEYYFIGDFKSGKAKFNPDYPNDPKKSTVKRVRAYNKQSLASKFIWHGKQYFPGEYYYGLPWWYGVKDWIRLANQIPVFHIAGLTKGYNIRWHIKIPISYFEQFPENERSNEEDTIMNELDAMLSGAENAGKAFVSRFSNDKDYPEWKIESLKSELYDQAYNDVFQHSNTALSSANNIDPSLAGYDITGKLSSGSEKRNSYLIHLALKTPRPRMILLKWLYDVKELNGWPDDLIFAFKDIEITTLDVNPTATQNTVRT
jgi:hypothetical protein